MSGVGEESEGVREYRGRDLDDEKETEEDERPPQGRRVGTGGHVRVAVVLGHGNLAPSENGYFIARSFRDRLDVTGPVLGPGSPVVEAPSLQWFRANAPYHPIRRARACGAE
jgi:hypothetical protein